MYIIGSSGSKERGTLKEKKVNFSTSEGVPVMRDKIGFDHRYELKSAMCD